MILSWAVAHLVLSVGYMTGPKLFESAEPLKMPITDVAVYGSGARISRKANVTATAETMAYRFAELPALVPQESLRLQAKGGKVVHLESYVQEFSELPLAELETLVTQLAQTQKERDRLKNLVALLLSEIQKTSQVKFIIARCL